MAYFCLVRHGQTNWNIEGKWQGHTDTSLNDVGSFQAEQVGEQLKNQLFNAIYSSDLLRAYKTAEIINNHHHLPIFKDKRLREQNLGNWEGHFLKDIPVLFPKDWQQFTTDPVNTILKGGESVNDLAARMMEFFLEIDQKHNQEERVLVVAHGLSLAVFQCMMENLPLTESFKRIPPNAMPNFVDWSPKRVLLNSRNTPKTAVDSR